MKHFKIATETNKMVVHLDTPLLTYQQAKEHASTLRQLAPGTPVYVINTKSE